MFSAQAIAAIPARPVGGVPCRQLARSSSSLDVPVDSGGSGGCVGSGHRRSGDRLPSRNAELTGLHLFESSLAFLAVEHVFRYATESGTRDAFHTPFFPGYFDSVQNLHGWADGDPFLVNYVGHPMQGAVAGFIWQHNDRAYRTVEFGKNSRYWKGKLRGAGFLLRLQSCNSRSARSARPRSGTFRACYPAARVCGPGHHAVSRHGMDARRGLSLIATSYRFVESRVEQSLRSFARPRWT